MFIDEGQVGRQAVEMLMEKFHEPDRPLAPREVQCRLEENATLAPPR
jgi:DNA-binding LacI/PurR family transcriptional regulator